MLLQSARRYNVVTVPPRWAAVIDNNYEMDGSMVLQKEAYENILQKSQVLHGSSTEPWRGHSHKLDKGDVIVLELSGGWVQLKQIRSRRALVQVAMAANN